MRSDRYRWIILAVALLSVTGALGFGRFGYSAILPSMQEGLGLSSAASGSLTSWNLVGYTIMCVVGGLLASRFGPRLVITNGMVLATAGMLVTGLSQGLPMASAGRLLVGVGGGMVNVPAVAMMSTWFPPHRRGLASSVAGSGPSIGFIVSGTVIPFIIASGGAGGWRDAWYFFAGATALLAIVSGVLLRDRPNSGIHHVSDSRAALDWKRIWRSGFIWYLGAVYFLFGLGYSISFTFFQRRLIHDLEYTSGEAGTLYMVIGLGSLLCGIIWGGVSDRVGRMRAVAISCFLQAVAAALFAFWPVGPSLLISAILIGLTALSIPGLMGAACGDRFGPALAPASLGFTTVFLGLSMVVGPLVAGALADEYGSLAPSFAVAMVSLAVGSVVALLHRERSPDRG
jgi:MFS family permease